MFKYILAGRTAFRWCRLTEPSRAPFWLRFGSTEAKVTRFLTGPRYYHCDFVSADHCYVHCHPENVIRKHCSSNHVAILDFCTIHQATLIAVDRQEASIQFTPMGPSSKTEPPETSKLLPDRRKSFCCHRLSAIHITAQVWFDLAFQVPSFSTMEV